MTHLVSSTANALSTARVASADDSLRLDRRPFLVAPFSLARLIELFLALPLRRELSRTNVALEAHFDIESNSLKCSTAA